MKETIIVDVVDDLRHQHCLEINEVLKCILFRALLQPNDASHLLFGDVEHVPKLNDEGAPEGLANLAILQIFLSRLRQLLLRSTFPTQKK